jgi:hypothetical protein
MYTLALKHKLYAELYIRAPELYDKAVERSARDGKKWDTRLDRNEAVARARLILNDSIPGVRAYILCDTHLMFASIGKMWWADKPWLIEQWYMRVAPGRSNPLAAVEKLADDNGCAATVFGTSLAAKDVALGRLLERSGYRIESTQYIKDYTWPQSQAPSSD